MFPKLNSGMEQHIKIVRDRDTHIDLQRVVIGKAQRKIKKFLFLDRGERNSFGQSGTLHENTFQRDRDLFCH